ncbi:MAG TPA: hypothetical protein ENO22_13060 [candidate division Zixibacteria bacterium]|nr:hypothetical protein [candidate division Zixibacteria bacterium]
MQNIGSFSRRLSGAIRVLAFILSIIFPLQFDSTLTASSFNESAVVRLRWTAPGDDGNLGRASKYDIRYSLDSLTEVNWNSAIQVENEPVPGVSGTTETFAVTGLEVNTEYYFALKSADAANNWSQISNVVSVTVSNIYLCGDVTGEGTTNITDVLTVINYVYVGTEIPGFLESADVNCDNKISISDVIYISNFIFLDGPAPCDSDFDGVPDC